MKRLFRLSNWFLLSAAIAIVIGCGGGGGGGGGDETGDGAAVPPALEIRANPNEFDSGDRTSVTVRLYDITRDPFILKVRYPKGLKYVNNSSFVVIDDQLYDIGPDKERSSSDFTYLVYFMDADLFFENREGTVHFQLEATKNTGEVEIEGDADVDNPLVDNSGEFNVNTPQFDPQDSTEIKVGEAEAETTPTPTATPAA
ncbi:MAG: hypothetical protein K1X83_03925 [Oligoflexia bacterium]|nr:hypothetical protein [Oligoflexia bacterium]